MLFKPGNQPIDCVCRIPTYYLTFLKQFMMNVYNYS